MRRLTPDHLQTLEQPLRLGQATPAASAAPVTAEDPAQRLQAAFDEARDRGFDEGMKDAGREVERRVEKIAQALRDDHAAAMASLQDSEDALRRLADALQTAVRRHAEDAETLAVEVAFAAVVRLLGEKATERSLMTELCRTVVREFGHPPATLRVSDSDLPLLETAQLEIPVEADRRLAPGQCVVDTARGQFESGLDVRLEAIKQSLLSGLLEHRGSP
jgi:flagellar biosynthesis/type III secretory pathway protein FliH